MVKPYRRALKARRANLAVGVRVPPSLIISITPICNLRCSGCFAIAAGTTGDRAEKGTLPIDEWRRIIRQASELGVFIFVIAGGEPFLYPGLVELCMEFKENWFVVLTNGTALREADLMLLKKASNVSVVVSLEGDKAMTDARRGEGVYEKAIETLGRLNRIGAMTGISTTITRHNFRYWMEEKNLDPLIEEGIKLGFFIEYIPTTPVTSSPMASCTPDDGSSENDHHMMLSPEDRREFRERMLEFRNTKTIYNIHSPGDEEFFGGCVSAGRGFAHITPAGDLTPCPVSTIATHNLTVSSLREALASPLFHEICKNEHLLETEGMPCALFAHPHEVDKLANRVGAYRTNGERN
jgi:MoaA/NifB/PqqE/SkfB family radical SAM enzyme